MRSLIRKIKKKFRMKILKFLNRLKLLKNLQWILLECPKKSMSNGVNLAKDGILKIEWNGLKLETPVKPQAPKNNFI
jgi:hypothetical protein